MKKLEDIPKKEIFEVPQGYFDALPNRIQHRITERKSAHGFSLAAFTWKYAIPVVLITAAGIFWYASQNSPSSADILLADVATEDLVAYLEDSDLSTEDLLEDISFDDTDAADIEEAVYEKHFDGASDEDLLEEMDLNTL